MTKFTKGNPGKPPGAKNKIAQTFKQAIMNTLADLQGSENNNLTAWANKNPTEFYKIAARLIPVELKAEVEHIQVPVITGFTVLAADPDKLLP